MAAAALPEGCWRKMAWKNWESRRADGDRCKAPPPLSLRPGGGPRISWRRARASSRIASASSCGSARTVAGRIRHPSADVDIAIRLLPSAATIEADRHDRGSCIWQASYQEPAGRCRRGRRSRRIFVVLETQIEDALRRGPGHGPAGLCRVRRIQGRFWQPVGLRLRLVSRNVLLAPGRELQRLRAQGRRGWGRDASDRHISLLWAAWPVMPCDRSHSFTVPKATTVPRADGEIPHHIRRRCPVWSAGFADQGSSLMPGSALHQALRPGRIFHGMRLHR